MSLLTAIEGHRKDIMFLLWLPDDRLASASQDNSIKIWDLFTASCTTTLTGHENALVLLPNGSMASGSSDGTIRIWDVDTGDCITVWGEDNLFVVSMVLMPDNQRLASGQANGTVNIWDISSGQVIATIATRRSGVSTLVPISDTLIACSSLDGFVSICDLNTQSVVKWMWLNRKGKSPLVLLPDGNTLFTCGMADSVQLLDIQTEQATRISGNWLTVSAMAKLPDSNRVVTGSRVAGILKVWDVDNMCCELDVPSVNSSGGGLGAYDINTLIVLPDGRVAGGCSDAKIRLWDIGDSSLLIFK